MFICCAIFNFCYDVVVICFFFDGCYGFNVICEGFFRFYNRRIVYVDLVGLFIDGFDGSWSCIYFGIGSV